MLVNIASAAWRRRPMDPQKRSAVEDQKEASRQLRGSIALELVNPTDHFSDANKNLLKFHGTYQQEDRDGRKNRSRAGLRKQHMLMSHCLIPCSRLAAAQ